jgi:D-galactose 1-dehydrogenase
MQPIRVGIVGVGKIARDQHIPSILANPDYVFAAACSQHSRVDGVPNYPSIEEMLSQVKDLDAVAICTPPQAHYQAAKFALQSGKHVLLEKPPCTSLSQLSHLVALAAEENLSLYQTWHSQHAAGVAPALQLLRQRRSLGVRVTWREDVRVWHPGQAWIWQSGGFGVLDPGINALSILTHLIAEPLFPESSVLYVPENCETPIAASVCMRCVSGAAIHVELDFRHTGAQTWDIDLDTDSGPMTLSAGGGELKVDNSPLRQDSAKLRSEYASIYARFAGLVRGGCSEVDARPMQLVADIFLVGRRVKVEPFRDAAP